MNWLLHWSVVLVFSTQLCAVISAASPQNIASNTTPSENGHLFPQQEIIISLRSAPVQRTPPISGIRFSSPGVQLWETTVDHEYSVLERKRIRQGFSKQVWVKIAPVANSTDPRFAGWVYWGDAAKEDSDNFRKKSASDPNQSSEQNLQSQ